MCVGGGGSVAKGVAQPPDHPEPFPQTPAPPQLTAPGATPGGAPLESPELEAMWPQKKWGPRAAEGTGFWPMEAPEPQPGPPAPAQSDRPLVVSEAAPCSGWAPGHCFRAPISLGPDFPAPLCTGIRPELNRGSEQAVGLLP